MIFFEEKNGSTIPMDLESKLLKERTIVLSGEINNELATKIVSELLCLDSINHDDINLYINSIGGNVTDGFAIYDTMNFIKSDVCTICVGEASSMGAIILLNGTKGKRSALENSEIMIHQPLGGVNGQATDIEITSKRINEIKERINKIIASKSGTALEKVKTDVERDYYMNAKEAQTYGLIDNIL